MKFSIYLIAVVAVLGALFVLFRPRDTAPAAPAAKQAASSDMAPMQGPAHSPATPVVAPATPPPAPLVFDLDIRRGRLVAGPSVIQVHKGDEVIIHLKSDTADELHLHGYDLHIKTKPGETASLRFNAGKTGRFGYELHHAKAELGALEVYP